MDQFERAERKREARTRLRAQRERAGQLRSRVIAMSLVCFALLWGVVFVQMATGNDPVLSRTASTAAAQHESASSDAGRQRRQSDQAAAPRSSRGAGSPPDEAATVVEAEPVEEVEAAPEPEPVITSQS